MIHNKNDKVSLQSLKAAGFLCTKHTHHYIGIKILFSTVLHVPLTNQQTAINE